MAAIGVTRYDTGPQTGGGSPLDPTVVIEGMMQVDAEKVAEAMPKREREKK
jgi:hypothetical protein